MFFFIYLAHVSEKEHTVETNLQYNKDIPLIDAVYIRQDITKTSVIHLSLKGMRVLTEDF